MHFILQSLPNAGQILSITWQFLFNYYGWVIFVIALVYILFKRYVHEIQHQFVHAQEWTFLSLKAPRENRLSTLAVENIFSQMHQLQSGKSFAEKYAEGQVQLWYSLEIVSLGGKISFILRIPKKVRDLVESAFYAHYPQIEITEINDYLENISYAPLNGIEGDINVYGNELKLAEDQSLPLRTYRDFEHPTAEEKIIDPLSNFFESMAKIQPHEFFGVQMLVTPVADEEWKPHAEHKVSELIGEEAHHDLSVAGALMSPFDKFAKFSYKEALLGGGHGHGHDAPTQKNNWMSMTEAQKERVNLIERKMSKPGYKTKIKLMYMAPKDKFDPGRRNLILGSYKFLGSAYTNKLKNDGNTATHVDYFFSKDLEAPYINSVLRKRKHYLFKGYKNRDVHIGRPGFVLNVEELATLFHFPITTETTVMPSAVDRSEVKTAQAPANLPVLEQ